MQAKSNCFEGKNQQGKKEATKVVSCSRELRRLSQFNFFQKVIPNVKKRNKITSTISEKLKQRINNDENTNYETVTSSMFFTDTTQEKWK